MGGQKKYTIALLKGRPELDQLVRVSARSSTIPQSQKSRSITRKVSASVYGLFLVNPGLSVFRFSSVSGWLIAIVPVTSKLKQAEPSILDESSQAGLSFVRCLCPTWLCARMGLRLRTHSVTRDSSHLTNQQLLLKSLNKTYSYILRQFSLTWGFLTRTTFIQR